MHCYEIEFYGRLLGAIGIRYTITDFVNADTPEAAVLKLYDKYDSVGFPRILKIY